LGEAPFLAHQADEFTIIHVGYGTRMLPICQLLFKNREIIERNTEYVAVIGNCHALFVPI
jgi:hypothetical protein